MATNNWTRLTNRGKIDKKKSSTYIDIKFEDQQNKKLFV